MTASVVVRRGTAYLAAVTDLADAIRAEHSKRGVWEAADFAWWWRRPRPSDRWPQRFWVDPDHGLVAAGILTDWGDRVAVDVLTTEAGARLAEEVWDRTLADASALGARLETMVDASDTAHVDRITGAGFVDSGARGGSAWIEAVSIPPVAPLADGYALVPRSQAAPELHHFAERNGPGVEDRLGETSLYDPELDLTIRDDRGDVVAYGLFWFDPVTRTGLVEPMGTSEGHRRRGLARHLLTAGLRRLVTAGATRIRINYDEAHEASRSLYLDAGFEPTMSTRLYVVTSTTSSGGLPNPDGTGLARRG